MPYSILTIIGARPQIIKAAALSRAIAEKYSDDLEEIILHTGQHYDTNMSDVFFAELGIPRPDVDLAIGSGSHGEQTAAMLSGIERVIKERRPDVVLVYGDTNSTIAGSLAASKLHVPVVHVEAGLRSFNKRMPEELNRIGTDHASTLLFSPTETGVRNLSKEGIMPSTPPYSIDRPGVFHIGDVMYDNSMHFASISDDRSTLLNSLGLESDDYLLSTVHRPSNTDDEEALLSIFSALRAIAQEGMTVVLPLHPRTKGAYERIKDKVAHERLLIIDPVSFLDMIALEKNAKMIITDSGGVQKESFFFKKPCIVLREETEWVELVENGTARLCGADSSAIRSAYAHFSAAEGMEYPDIYGDGRAAEEICRIVLDYLNQ